MSEMKRIREALVTASPKLNLRELPAPTGKPIGHLPYQTVVEVLKWDLDDTWAYVACQGQRGYAMKEYLRPIKEEESAGYEKATLQDTCPQSFDEDSSFSSASGYDRPYLVFQVTLKEKLFGTGSGNLTELENVINHYANRGYRLHTLSTAHVDSKGFGGGDRIQATLVFERMDLRGGK